MLKICQWNVQFNSKKIFQFQQDSTKPAFYETGYIDKQDEACVDPTPLTKEHHEPPTDANPLADDVSNNTTQEKTTHSAEAEANVRGDEPEMGPRWNGEGPYKIDD